MEKNKRKSVGRERSDKGGDKKQVEIKDTQILNKKEEEEKGERTSERSYMVNEDIKTEGGRRKGEGERGGGGEEEEEEEEEEENGKDEEKEVEEC
ncbi:hypothetical protein Pmani_023024 [Petrolisthes manimaculis]|uniref:Uncharacterized protein n=1 Tax=Petrolisthes manimaculis TaxID=1843537 RepID=A0AAE1PAY5_9EUCA|nr:hypothetical protein Pmani_023024 [Petrolisthes manimaculis]